ncbi:hypothetical protein DFH08DRAFT_1047351 [Mycena albidolilacea]|uniref:Uncharacterized protein n=1 Tax=Mycena albidolilacea TaxID=1033008 RepID=A0AAD7AEC2_9AGAR|nr:hypothetical protein DFH08DRAFT_1047351 [Mycena albidolilacea]
MPSSFTVAEFRSKIPTGKELRPELEAGSMTFTEFTPFPVRVRATLLEHIERTKQTSKADIVRLIEESELKIICLEGIPRAARPRAGLRRRAPSQIPHLPIRTLPVELLAEIFGLTIRDHTHIKDAFRISIARLLRMETDCSWHWHLRTLNSIFRPCCLPDDYDCWDLTSRVWFVLIDPRNAHAGDPR